MVVTYTASEQDFVRAGMLMLRKKGVTRKQSWIAGILLASLAVVLVTNSFGAQHFSRTDVVKIIPVVVLAFFLLRIPSATRNAIAKQYRNSPSLSETRTIQADFSGFHSRSVSASADQAWSVYEAFCEDNDSFLLIQQGTQIFVPIPKRELSEQQVDEVHSVLSTYLPKW